MGLLAALSNQKPLVSGRCYWQVASGLGPPRPIQHACRPLRFDSTQTVPGASFAPALAQQGGVAVSRLDGRGISLLRRMTLITTSQAHRCTCVTMKKITRPYPDPVPRISVAISSHYWPALASLGSDASHLATTLSSPALTSLAATLTRLACRAFRLISFGWPDRWPPVPAVPAFACFARPTLLREPDSVSGAFSFSADHLRVRRRKEIYAPEQKIRREIDNCKLSYPPTITSAFTIIAWAVHKAVEKLTQF